MRAPWDTSGERSRFDPWLLAILVPSFALQLAYLDVVPLFDSADYTEQLKTAIYAHDLPWGLNCAAHPTMAYMAVIAALLKAFPHTFAPVHVANGLLGCLALWALHATLRRVFPGPERRVDVLLIVATVAAMPILNASRLHFTPDTGVYFAFVLLVAAITSGRFWAVVVSGLLLAYSKESGTIAYGLALGAWAAVAFVVRDRSQPLPWKRLFALGALASIPVLAAAAFFVVRAVVTPPGGSVAWRGANASNVAASLSFLNPFDPHFRSHLAGMFAIDFHWVPTGLLVAWLGAVLASPRSWRARLEAPAARFALFTALVFAVGFAGLTGFRTYSYFRYVLFLYPLFAVLFGLAILRFVRAPALRIAAFSGVIALFVLSNFSTVDPVSKKLYGTFPFGSHEMLKVTSIARECCGYGLDGLTYNLEFTKLHDVQDLAMRALQPGPGAVLAANKWAMSNAVSYLDRATFARAPFSERAFFPETYRVWDHHEFPPGTQVVYYLGFPNVANGPALAELKKSADLVEVKSFEVDGYELKVGVLYPRPR